MNNSSEKLEKNENIRATPAALSQQLGVPVYDILEAIESAHIQPIQNQEGQLEYEVNPVVSSLVENKRIQQSAENPHVQRLLRECLETYQDALRRMIREENKTAYEIKQMTESRFLEVLGQLSISLGRLEAFVAQSSRVLTQIDMRLARLGHTQVKPLLGQGLNKHQSEADIDSSSSKLHSPISQSVKPAWRSAAVLQMTQQEHWLAFETFLTQVLNASGQISESALRDWFENVKALTLMGSLELRLRGEPLLSEIRAALSHSFSELLARMPGDQDVLPAYENYFAWVQAEVGRGYPALLLFLLVLLNRGAQISWSGFLSTFVSEG